MWPSMSRAGPFRGMRLTLQRKLCPFVSLSEQNVQGFFVFLPWQLVFKFLICKDDNAGYYHSTSTVSFFFCSSSTCDSNVTSQLFIYLFWSFPQFQKQADLAKFPKFGFNASALWNIYCQMFKNLLKVWLETLNCLRNLILIWKKHYNLTYVVFFSFLCYVVHLGKKKVWSFLSLLIRILLNKCMMCFLVLLQDVGV